MDGSGSAGCRPYCRSSLLATSPAVLSLIAAGHVAGTTLHLPAATVAIAALPFVVQYAASALRYVLPPTLRSSIAVVPSLICAYLLAGPGDVVPGRHPPSRQAGRPLW